MTGTIYHSNHTRGMYSVKHEDGSFTVIELMDSSELSKGDIVSGNFTNHGDMKLRNNTTNETISVYIQVLGCTEQQAIRQTMFT